MIPKLSLVFLFTAFFASNFGLCDLKASREALEYTEPFLTQLNLMENLDKGTFDVYWKRAKSHFDKAEKLIKSELKKQGVLPSEKIPFYDLLETLYLRKMEVYSNFQDLKKNENISFLSKKLRGVKAYNEKAESYLVKALHTRAEKQEILEQISEKEDSPTKSENQELDSFFSDTKSVDSDEEKKLIQTLDQKVNQLSASHQVNHRKCPQTPVQPSDLTEPVHKAMLSLIKYLTSRGIKYNPDVLLKSVRLLLQDPKACCSTFSNLQRQEAQRFELGGSSSNRAYKFVGEKSILLDFESDPERILGEGGFNQVVRMAEFIDGEFRPRAVRVSLKNLKGAEKKAFQSTAVVGDMRHLRTENKRGKENSESSSSHSEKDHNELHIISKISELENKSGIVAPKVDFIKGNGEKLNIAPWIISPIYKEGDLQKAFNKLDDYYDEKAKSLSREDAKTLADKILHLKLDHLEKVIEGVANLHKGGIIHSDLKTLNTLAGSLTNANDTVVADFDLSADWDSVDFMFGAGTPGFQAPEALFYSEKSELDFQRDTFSLGVMLADEVLPRTAEPLRREIRNHFKNCSNNNKGSHAITHCYYLRIHEQMSQLVESSRDLPPYQRRLIVLATRAIHPDPKARLSVARFLEELRILRRAHQPSD